VASEQAEEGQERSTVRSTIAFPYGDLQDAVSVALALHDHYGGRATADQLAAALNSTMKSGTFRLRMATARTFGVIEGKGTIALSDLGRRVVDPATEAQARAEAFLRVPLYAAVYESHKGATLPGDRGLEAEMRELGVSVKQVGKARQAFQRSADQAGFFGQGNTRLVAPAALPPVSYSPEGPPKSPRPQGGGLDNADPLIVGLFRKLPAPETRWPEGEQAKWLELAKHILPAVYGSDERPSRA
jgi:hypothetical protein